MSSAVPVTRRLLLRRFSAGASVLGTFPLPPALHEAMALHGAPTVHDAPALHGVVSPHDAKFPHDAKSLHDAKVGQPRPAGKAPARDTKGAARPLPLVMLDPGHGGKDPGAIGVSGTYEKHVALAAALELKRQLEAGGRYRVELTRTRDVFIPLDGRVEYAQRREASLFVSMHADALSDHSVRGASVYTLARMASDAQSAALALKENSADRFIGRQWHAASPEVSHILASLVRQETRIGSVRIARNLVGSLVQDLPMLQNPDRHAGFVVLKAADIPSVLVEMGFMSNPRDEAALRRAEHRKLVAQAMHRAVDAFFAGTAYLAGGAMPRFG